MGVENPRQIAGFSVSSLDNVDFLRVDYKRPKNSVLPVGKTFRFPRVQDSGETGSKMARMRTCPALREAIAELEDIVESRADKGDIAAAMREEIQRLQEEINLRTEQLLSLIDRMESD